MSMFNTSSDSKAISMYVLLDTDSESLAQKRKRRSNSFTRRPAGGIGDQWSRR